MRLFHDVQPKLLPRSTISPPQPGVGHGPITVRSASSAAESLPCATSSAASSGLMVRPPCCFQMVKPQPGSSADFQEVQE